MRSNTDGDKIAKAFLNHKPAKTDNAKIGFSMHGGRTGRRLITDGNEILSYEWWLVAYWLHDDAIAITTDRYSPTGQKFKNGNLKYSPTTDAHIGSVVYAAQAKGFFDSGNTFANADGRNFAIYRKG
jgi:hypothetical protein